MNAFSCGSIKLVHPSCEEEVTYIQENSTSIRKARHGQLDSMALELFGKRYRYDESQETKEGNYVRPQPVQPDPVAEYHARLIQRETALADRVLDALDQTEPVWASRNNVDWSRGRRAYILSGLDSDLDRMRAAVAPDIPQLATITPARPAADITLAEIPRTLLATIKKHPYPSFFTAWMLLFVVLLIIFIV